MGTTATNTNAIYLNDAIADGLMYINACPSYAKKLCVATFVATCRLYLSDNASMSDIHESFASVQDYIDAHPEHFGDEINGRYEKTASMCSYIMDMINGKDYDLHLKWLKADALSFIR